MAAAALLGLSAFSVSARPLSAYKAGDLIESDIVTPVPLVVIDPQATAELKAREGERIPAVFRFLPEAAEESVTAFHKSFLQTRGRFLDAVEQAFDARKLDEEALATVKFSNVIVAFERKNKLFPVTTELARIWAAGESGEQFESPLRASLRGQMSAFIRETNNVPDGAKVGSTVRVVTYGANETLTEQMVSRHGKNHPKTDLVSFQRARTDLQGTFPPEDRAVAKYLSTFLQPNCFAEVEMTIAMRAKRTAALCATDAFAAGQVVARRGQSVDAKTLAALEMLAAKTAATAPQAPVAPTVPSPPAPTVPPKKYYWLFGGALGGLAIAVSLLALFRRRQPASLVPMRVEPPAVPLPAGEWQQRAIAAERRAEKAQSVIREGVISHLARWMSDTLVQKLLLQRAHLIETQQKAVTEVDKLGQRLDTIHTRMQGRLSVYEQRISELEKELDTKDEINRELIQAEIKNIRRQMDAERVKSEGGLN